MVRCRGFGSSFVEFPKAKVEWLVARSSAFHTAKRAAESGKSFLCKYVFSFDGCRKVVRLQALELPATDHLDYRLPVQSFQGH